MLEPSTLPASEGGVGSVLPPALVLIDKVLTRDCSPGTYSFAKGFNAMSAGVRGEASIHCGWTGCPALTKTAPFRSGHETLQTTIDHLHGAKQSKQIYIALEIAV